MASHASILAQEIPWMEEKQSTVSRKIWTQLSNQTTNFDCISFMTSDVEHVFIYQLAIGMSFQGKTFIQLSYPFLNCIYILLCGEL